MFKYIVVPSTGADTDGPVFATALSVARLWASHLEFLHVRADVQQVIMAMAASDIGGGSGVEQIIETLDRDVTARQDKAQRDVREFCASEQIEISDALIADRTSAEWRVETGDELVWLGEHGRAADLVVVGRVREGEAVAIDVLEAALLGTGRPVLIAARKSPRVGVGTVAIAWKDTPEAAHAVAAAMPFVRRATRVVILSVEEDAKSTEPSCERLRHAVRWQNPQVTVHHLQQDGRHPVETMLEGVAALGADLLVMGGYSHSRMREVVFGGFTRRVLKSAELPVLMAH